MKITILIVLVAMVAFSEAWISEISLGYQHRKGSDYDFTNESGDQCVCTAVTNGEECADNAHEAAEAAQVEAARKHGRKLSYSSSSYSSSHHG